MERIICNVLPNIFNQTMKVLAALKNNNMYIKQFILIWFAHIYLWMYDTRRSKIRGSCWARTASLALSTTLGTWWTSFTADSRLPGATVNNVQLELGLEGENVIDREKDPPTPFRSVVARESADLPVYDRDWLESWTFPECMELRVGRFKQKKGRDKPFGFGAAARVAC